MCMCTHACASARTPMNACTYARACASAPVHVHLYLCMRTVAHVCALAAAPIGACFTLICLTTGSLWGKPMWGTWWVWDARLTSVLVLFFLYLGFIALANAFDDAARGEKASAILALIGAVNLPIIKYYEKDVSTISTCPMIHVD